MLVAAYLQVGMFGKNPPADQPQGLLPPPTADLPPAEPEPQNDDAAIRELMQMLGVSPPPPKAP